MTVKKSIAECSEAIEMFAKEHGYKAYVPEAGLDILCVKDSDTSKIFLNAYVFTLSTDFYYGLDDEDEAGECRAGLANLFNEMVQDKLGANCFKFGSVRHHEVHILF